MKGGESLQEIARMLLLSGADGGSLDRILTALRSAECRCALDMQKKQRLSGDIEADGTGLRNWKHGDRICANMYTRQSIHSINSSCFFESSLFRINTKKRLGRFSKNRFLISLHLLNNSEVCIGFSFSL